MSELKPCPFCGGDAELLFDGSTGKYTFLHDGKAGCPAAYVHFASFSTEPEAVAAWNTRAERTCRIVSSNLLDMRDFSVSEMEMECGYTFDCGEFEPPSYCPNCGRKVVS